MRALRSFHAPQGYCRLHPEGGLTAFLSLELAAVVRDAVICRNSDGFEPLQRSLLSNIPMYQLDSGAERVAHTRIRLFGADILNAADHSTASATSFLDHPDVCCLRLAQRGLTNFLFQPIYRKHFSHKSHENLTEKLAEIMKSDLSPTYGNEHRRSHDTSLRYLRCFTMDDLHPP